MLLILEAHVVEQEIFRRRSPNTSKSWNEFNFGSTLHSKITTSFGLSGLYGYLNIRLQELVDVRFYVELWF